MSAPCPTFGYRVGMELAAALSPEADEMVRNAWIAFLEGRGLYCGGAGGSARLEYVVASEASQATDGDRAATRAWLSSRRELRAWQVGGLEDLERAV